jgi:hypothetical protein
MQVKPVLSKAAPEYPTHDFLQEHPELLRIVPERWRRNPFVLRVLAGVGCLLLAVQSAGAQERANAPASRVAPLFIHGEGRGGFGCIVVNPPVFLSEDEALQVIRDESGKAGLKFSAAGPKARQAELPVTNECGFGRPDTRGTQKQDLSFDGFDKKHNVAFEFVSEEHFVKWEGKTRRRCGTVSVFDMKGTAEILRSGLASSPGLPWVGVFYEPGAHPPRERPGTVDPRQKDWQVRAQAMWKEQEEAGRQLGEAELREQVRDFIEWLKAQGVI